MMIQSRFATKETGSTMERYGVNWSCVLGGAKWSLK